jgi:hypothetical protein
VTYTFTHRGNYPIFVVAVGLLLNSVKKHRLIEVPNYRLIEGASIKEVAEKTGSG